MARFTIERRAILRGAGGVALGLPVLEIMRGAGRALAEGCPKRFIVTYLGTSVSNCYHYQNYKDGHAKGQMYDYDFVTPLSTGVGYESTIGLEPIFKAGVQDVMGLVSGLKIPVMFADPPFTVSAAIHSGFHGRGDWPQLAGTSNYTPGDPDPAPAGASADQLILGTISGDTLKRFPTGLQLSVSPLYKQTLSYGPTDGKDRWGRPRSRPIAAYTSPKGAYDALFGTVTPGAASTADTGKNLARQKSVVDAVKKRAERLLGRLGAGDKIRMERYFDNIRALETRLQTVGPTVGAGCQLPTPIVSDPRAGIQDDTKSYWSEDTTRAQLQSDLIYHAFQCDQTRVVSWMFDGNQSRLDLEAILGFGGLDLHGATHSFNDPNPPWYMAKAIAWYINPVAQLVKCLKETDDMCGGKMIDNTVIVMLLEGGHGRSSDYQTEGQIANEGDNKEAYAGGLRFAHSHENMVMICAGGRNLGLQLGQHIHFNNDRHPAQVMYTALRALGLNGPFGEISTDLPEIRSLKS